MRFAYCTLRCDDEGWWFRRLSQPLNLDLRLCLVRGEGL